MEAAFQTTRGATTGHSMAGSNTAQSKVGSTQIQLRKSLMRRREFIAGLGAPAWPLAAGIDWFAISFVLIAYASSVTVSDVQGADLFRQQSGVDSAVARYGVSGRGVAIAILDRGIEWQNPDFIKPDGTTRIKWLLDMSGQGNYCNNPRNPTPVEYSEAQINAAIAGGPPLDTRDAVGHGTLTAGIAAGNGRAFAKGTHHGVAPEADLIIVKLLSDGAPAHGGHPAENFFHGCTSQALDWLDQKIALLAEPVVGLINSGIQLWGPTDGTSILSRKIDEVFGSRRGRIFVAPSGDEGDLPTHAGGMYTDNATTVNLIRSKSSESRVALWFIRDRRLLSQSGSMMILASLWCERTRPAHRTLQPYRTWETE